MDYVSASRRLLGWGSLFFGGWGLIHPESLTRLMGDDPKLGPALGVRDTVVGLLLLGNAGPAPLLARAASDASDAIRLRRRSPSVAAGAVAFGVWAAVAAIAAYDRRR